VTAREINEIVDNFRSGDEASAFFTLIELPGNVLPALIEIFRAEPTAEVRAFLVKAAWERREEAVVPFLGEALGEPEDEVWQQALDGLVAFASKESLEILKHARNRKFVNASDGKRFRLWLDEAIAQVQDVMSGRGALG
jgi:hypothetical protein